MISTETLVSLSGGAYSWMSRPFTVKAKGLWSVATDGIWLVAIKGKHFDDKTKAEVIEYLTEVPKNSKMTSISKIRAWTGEHQSRFFDPEKQDFGSIFDFVIDRRKLAYLLNFVSEDTTQIWKAKKGVLGLGSNDWRIILAGIDSEQEKDYPVFSFKQLSELELIQSMLE